MDTAPPQCCNETATYVFISHQCQFYVCHTCKQEVYATPQLEGMASKTEVTPPSTIDMEGVHYSIPVGWYVVV